MKKSILLLAFLLPGIFIFAQTFKSQSDTSQNFPAVIPDKEVLATQGKKLYADHPDSMQSNRNLIPAEVVKTTFKFEIELTSKSSCLDTGSINWDISYDNLKEVRQKMLVFYLEILSNLEKIRPADHPELAIYYNLVAILYHNLENYQEALKFNLKTLAISEKQPFIDPAALVEFKTNTARTYSSLKEYQKALEIGLEILTILEKKRPDNELDLAQLYTNVAWLYHSLGDYKNQLALNFKALAIQEKIRPADHPALASSYFDLGVAYGNLGEFQTALEVHLKALAIYEKKQPTDLSDLAKVYHHLGWAYGELGNYQNQLEYHSKALALYEKSLPVGHLDFAIFYNDLAHAHYNLKNPEKVLEFQLKALAICEKALLPPDDLNLARSYSQTGCAYAKLGQLSQARIYFEKFEKINNTGRVFSNWAMYYALQNDTPRALENLQKAVELGYNDLKWIETDDSLESIRGEQRYKELVEKLKK